MQQNNHTPVWGDFEEAAQRHYYLNQLFKHFDITGKYEESVACYLNSKTEKSIPGKSIPKFRDQSYFEGDGRYYEQIIANSRQIPTRETSWHDFFNGLIWLQFPQTKALLSQMHVQEIDAYGLHPRTLVRNQITHFDECGLVLLGLHPIAQDIVDLLSNHQWQEALLDMRQYWGKAIYPIVFGHANLEMLLNPFMNLTAKWVFVELTDIGMNAFFDNDTFRLTRNNFSIADSVLCEALSTQDTFNKKGNLKPLPLLGIPEWHPQQDQAFYAQANVFRPKRR